MSDSPLDSMADDDVADALERDLASFENDATAPAAAGAATAGGPGPSGPSGPGGRPRSTARRPPASPARLFKEYAVLAVAAIVLASLVRAFLGQAYWIPSPSMHPTLKIGDRVIVSRLSYRLGDPERGDIVVFQNPDYRDTGRKDPLSKGVRSLLEVVGIGQPKEKYFIKRVIGMPGDRLEVKNDHVYINGKQLKEPWLQPGVRSEWEPGGSDPMRFGSPAFTIPAHQYFMMGDNREQSRDSRYFGPIQRSKMVGRAFVRIWPVGRFGGL